MMMMSQAIGDQMTTTEEHHPQYDAPVIEEERISDLEGQQILDDDLEQDKKTATTDEESSFLQEGETDQVSKVNAEILRTEGSKEEQTEKEELLESWIIDINKHLDDHHTDVEDDSGSLGCSFRYPPVRLRTIQADAFYPKLVTIGPIIVREAHEMERHKKRLLVRLLGGRKKKSEEKFELDEISSSSDDEGSGCRRMGPVKLEDIVKSMKLLEERTRDWDQYYGYGSIKRMVLDGCFVIEVLRFHWRLTHSSKISDVVVKDPIFCSASTVQTLQREFLIMGNQFPFFLLKELYLLTSDDTTREPPLRCLVIHFLKELAGEDEEDAGISLLEDDQGADECHHLLHLFSYACTDKSQRYLSLQDIVLVKKQQVGKKLTYNAKELQEAGVKIKPKQHTKGGGLMAIDTIKGTTGITLRIQPFYLDHNVVSMLLNFLAFEQCQSEVNPYFTSYIMFLDCLIDSEADVEILHKAGILNHAFGNNRDVANLIYKVTRELNDPEFNHFHDEMMELNSYCKAYYGSKWRPWWRNLRNNYCGSPWTITSLVAATILLILTFVQTFYTTYAYYRPPN